MKRMTKRIADDWKSQDWYYDAAENWLTPFWNDKSIFYPLFERLDCTHIVELACGRGRHVPFYIEKAETIALVDVNPENIQHCRKRYASAASVSCIVNSGNNFNAIEDESKTAIFSYDSMVHFELIDIHSYLVDSYRILQKRGRALFHHSNYSACPGAYYLDNPHFRNFCSADIFSHLAIRAGFNVLSQSIIPWGYAEAAIANIDCITLCEKAE